MKVFPASVSVFLLTLCTVDLLHAQYDEQTQSKLIKMHTAWSTKPPAPGPFVQAKEVAREGSQVRYHLVASGLPTDGLYTVLSWPIGKTRPATVFRGATIGPDGTVICAGRTPEQCGDSSRKDDPVEFMFNPIRGEPVRLALQAGKAIVATVVVPDPLTTNDRACALSVERLLPHFDLAYVKGSGFPPSTKISFIHQTNEEKYPLYALTDAEGNLHFALSPAVPGRLYGTATVEAVGTTCSPSIKFEWRR